MSTSKNFPKTIKDQFSDFEKTQLRLLKQLTIDDILNNIPPYQLIIRNPKSVTEIVNQALDRIFDVQQYTFFSNLTSHLVSLSDVAIILDTHLKTYNASFTEEKSKIANKLSLEFLRTFCNSDGSINWEKLVEWNSGNFDLDSVFSP